MMLDFINEEKMKGIAKRIMYIFTFIWTLLFVNSTMFTSISANSKFLFIALMFMPVAIALIMSLIAGNRGNKIFAAILLTVWIAGTVFMSLIGVRFILLLAPATSIAFGIGLYYLSKIVNAFFTEEFKLKGYFQNVYGFAAASILFVVLFMPIASNALLISDNSIPNFDDAWYQSMYNIKDNSQEDAIITSWWDFGHFFAAIAERGVTFDGASQTTPQSHWVGKLLLENDEEVSHDILKMLVCGGNNAFDYILEVSEDNTEGVKTNKLLYSTFGKSDEEKIELFENYKYYSFTDEQIEEVMQSLACSNPSENFVITSEDMVGKAGVWAHWGSWDFTKKYVHDNYNKMTNEQIALELDEDIGLVNQYVSELEAIDSRAQIENIKREVCNISYL
jgi:asparagine N-glycosylation enzyme membrane subunit Stt3